MKLDKFFKILTYEQVAFFGKAQKNRKLSDKHVNEFVTILKDTTFVPDEDGDMLAYGIMPIVVNPVTMHILDGQHKLKAFKDAIDKCLIPSDVKILVAYWFVYDEAHENEITIMLNSKSKNWSLNDYLDAYAHDITYYSRLKTFCETHSLCKKINPNTGNVTLNYRYGAAIITGKGCQDSLKQGTFSFTDDQFASADVIHKELEAIRRKLGYDTNSAEVEFMAIAWHEKRVLMSADDIVALKYIPVSIRTKKVNSRKDWIEVFALLRDVIDTKAKNEEE